jgi:pimeloyl-ACP methyl ester carboxylesterase
MTTVDDVWVDYLCDALRSYRLDFRAPPLASPTSLARFERPTLVLGAADDIFFPVAELLERAKVIFPRAETELLEGRHVPPLTDAFRSWLGARVTRFLEPAPVAAPHATAA